jgi:hypothetical protein
MSGNRANASAIQRRSVNQPQPQQQQQQQRPVTGNQRNQPQQQSSKQAPVQTPKLSVSDAMALVSIRLGRVETFINAMPTLDQLHSSTSGHEQSFDTNTRMVDEAVFTSIVSRLEKVEKMPTILTSSTDTSIEDKFNSLTSDVTKINSLSTLLDNIKMESDLSKILLLNFQNNIQQLNQKLDIVIDTQSNQQDQLQHLQEQIQTYSKLPDQNQNQIQPNCESEDDETTKSIEEGDEIVSTDLKELVLNNTISVNL